MSGETGSNGQDENQRAVVVVSRDDGDTLQGVVISVYQDIEEERLDEQSLVKGLMLGMQDPQFVHDEWERRK